MSKAKWEWYSPAGRDRCAHCGKHLRAQGAAIKWTDGKIYHEPCLLDVVAELPMPRPGVDAGNFGFADWSPP